MKPLLKLILAWSFSSIPYVLIVTYAGSISTVNNLKPAIFTAVVLSTFFWTAWFFFNQYTSKENTHRV